MRSTIIAAAFAATAAAVPYANPDVVTEYHTDVAYVTNVVTVTQGGSEPTTVAAADAAPTYDPGNHWNKGGNGGWHWPHKNKSKKTKTKTRTQAAPSPPPAAPTSTYEQPAPAPQPTQEPEPQPSQGAPSGLTSYNDIVVAHHNVHRANHSSPDVQWDSGLAATAQKIADSCVYAHNVEMDGGGYGQNIAAGVEKGNVSAVITDLFYNGEIGYFMNEFGKAQPSMTQFELWGHFTQIVWKETSKVGCATQYCPNGLGNVGSNVSPYFTVCNYSPPGNYANEYSDNVGDPKGEATVQWNYGM